MKDQGEFSFGDGGNKMTCPVCRGTGKVNYEEVASHTFRSYDPETSVAAGKRHEHQDVGRFSARSQKASLLIKFDQGVRMTAQEIAVAVTGQSEVSIIEGCRRRCSDLFAAGYIKDTGERRANAGSPADSIVWEISGLGQSALAHLLETGWTR